jgi:ethanolamine-phosphate cytidylyltransferase
MATTRRIMHFSNKRDPLPTDTIVYVAGSFDMLHNGHIDYLRKAKARGDFVYVGLWSDEVTKKVQGKHFPLVTLQERVLMTLANRFVDDVIIGAPYEISQDMIRSLNIKKVIVPSTQVDLLVPRMKDTDPYKAAKDLGIYEEINLDCKMTIETISARVAEHRDKHETKFKKWKGRQDKYYTEEKQFVAEI